MLYHYSCIVQVSPCSSHCTKCFVGINSFIVTQALWVEFKNSVYCYDNNDYFKKVKQSHMYRKVARLVQRFFSCTFESCWHDAPSPWIPHVSPDLRYRRWYITAVNSQTHSSPPSFIGKGFNPGPYVALSGHTLIDSFSLEQFLLLLLLLLFFFFLSFMISTFVKIIGQLFYT